MEELKKRDLWSDRQIREMLSIVHEKHNMQLTDNKIKRNRTIFEDIANELKKKAITKSHVQIRTKFKSLKCDYFRAKKKNNKRATKRQTWEHFELLDEIFGRHSTLEAEEVDAVELDCENIKTENIFEIYEEPSSESILGVNEDPSQESILGGCEGPSEKDFQEEDPGPSQESFQEKDLGPSQANAADENNLIDEAEENKLRSFRQARKPSYQKVLESFTKEWKETQQDLLQKIQEHDQKLMDQQFRKQEELLEKSLEAMDKILEKDREETAKLLQEFLSALHPTQSTFVDQIKMEF